MAIEPSILKKPLTRQFGVIVGLAIVAAAAVFLWVREPTFGVLYSGLGAKDVAAVVEQLKRSDVDYRFNEAAGTIFVPAEEMQRLRVQLAGAGLPRGGDIDRGQEPGRNSAEIARSRQALEQELAGTIAEFSGVQTARVHLATSERGLGEPSASVMVKLFPGRAFEREQVAAITYLVAAGVPDLEPRRVTVVDHKGVLLSTEERDPEVAAGRARIEQTRMLEQAYASRIRNILTPVLGADRARVQVWLDMDYGVAGRTVTDAAALRNESAPDLAGDSIAVNAQVKRLSVVVALDDRLVSDAEAGLSHHPRTGAEIALVTKLIKNAVGFDAQRGDTVNVVNMPSASAQGPGSLPETTSWEAWPWGFLEEFSVWIVAAVALLFALGAAIRSIGMSRSGPEAARTEESDIDECPMFEADASGIQSQEPERSPDVILEQLRDVVLQDAKQPVQVIRSWVAEDKHPAATAAAPRNRLSGAERAAIFLMALGESGAVEITKHLEPKEVQKIGEAMVGTHNVIKPQVDSVIRNFSEDLAMQTGLGVGSQDFLRRVLGNALGEETAAGMIDRILLGRSSRGLGALKWMEPRAIADVIRAEHPQIIAIVLSYLDPDQAAGVLAALPENMRPGVLMRVASLDGIQPEALAVLDEVLDTQFSASSGSIKACRVGGKRMAANILKFTDGAQEARILEKVRDREPALAQSIEDLMFAFENLADIDDRSMQALLREVSSEGLVTALKGADEAVRAKVFKNMSKRAAEMLYDDLEARGPVRAFEIQAAQKEILAIVRSMAEAGNLSLAESADEQV